MSLACLVTRRRRLRLQCSVGRHCNGGLRMSLGRLGQVRRSCWARCVMRGEKEREGCKRLEMRSQHGAPVKPLSFSSFTFLIFVSSLLLILTLSSCRRSFPTEPGVVNFLIESMPTNLDPRIGTDGQSERIDGLIFDSLVELDEQRNPRGDLAEKWEMPDGVTYVFQLRPGVKFHDGRVLTSADVKYTFDSILNRSVMSPKRGSLNLIESVDTPDTATVIFHLG